MINNQGREAFFFSSCNKIGDCQVSGSFAFGINSPFFVELFLHVEVGPGMQLQLLHREGAYD